MAPIKLKTLSLDDSFWKITLQGEKWCVCVNFDRFGQCPRNSLVAFVFKFGKQDRSLDVFMKNLAAEYTLSNWVLVVYPLKTCTLQSFSVWENRRFNISSTRHTLRIIWVLSIISTYKKLLAITAQVSLIIILEKFTIPRYTRFILFEKRK